MFFKKKAKKEDELISQMPFYDLNKFSSISYDLILRRNEKKEDEFTLMFSYFIQDEKTLKFDKGFKIISQYKTKTKEQMAKIVQAFYWLHFAGQLKTHSIGMVYGEDFSYENDWGVFNIFTSPSKK